AAADRGTSGLEEELLRQVERMPESAAALLVGVVQVTAVLAPLANLAALIWRRRLRILAQVLVAAGVAAVATTVAEDVLDRPPVRRPPAIEDARYLAGSDFPSGPYLAAVTATLVVMAPWLPRRWRHVLIT